MAITLELYELKNLCMEMASLGAANYVKQTTPAKDLVSQREAYRLFKNAVLNAGLKMVGFQHKGVVVLYVLKFFIHVLNLWQLINLKKSTL